MSASENIVQVDGGGDDGSLRKAARSVSDARTNQHSFREGMRSKNRNAEIAAVLEGKQTKSTDEWIVARAEQSNLLIRLIGEYDRVKNQNERLRVNIPVGHPPGRHVFSQSLSFLTCGRGVTGDSFVTERDIMHQWIGINWSKRFRHAFRQSKIRARLSILMLMIHAPRFG